MDKFNLKTLFIFMLLGCLTLTKVNAQTIYNNLEHVAEGQTIDGNGQDCLGIWCYVNASLSDPLVGGRLVYTIPMPSEPILYIFGPGAPHLFNSLGRTIELHLSLPDLILELDGHDSVQLDLELVVDKRSSFGTNSHYHIKLNVRP